MRKRTNKFTKIAAQSSLDNELDLVSKEAAAK
jgi:hypothetical protein